MGVVSVSIGTREALAALPASAQPPELLAHLRWCLELAMPDLAPIDVPEALTQALLAVLPPGCEWVLASCDKHVLGTVCNWPTTPPLSLAERADHLKVALDHLGELGCTCREQRRRAVTDWLAGQPQNQAAETQAALEEVDRILQEHQPGGRG